MIRFISPNFISIMSAFPYTEQDLIKSQVSQLVRVCSLITQKKLTLKDLEALIPSVVLMAQRHDLRYDYISSNFSRHTYYESKELLGWSEQDVLGCLVLPSQHKNILQKINSLTQEGDIISYLQSIKRKGEKEFRHTYFSAKMKLGEKSRHVYISLHSPLKNWEHVVKKSELVLGRDSFFVTHHERFMQLSDHEKEVLRLIALGHKRKEIADLKNISVYTYDTHRKNIRKKLDVHNWKELLRYAEAFGLV